MLARIARTFETSDIHEMPEFQRKVQEMSEFFLRHQLTEKLHLHYAYAYIMKLPDTQPKMEFILNIGFNQAVATWLERWDNDQYQGLVPSDLKTILEVIAIELKFLRFHYYEQFALENSRLIRSMQLRVKNYVCKELTEKYLDCIHLLRCIKPQQINKDYYSNMLAPLTSRSNDFYQLLMEVFMSLTAPNIKVVDNILQGWVNRLKELRKKNEFTVTEKYETFHAFQAFAIMLGTFYQLLEGFIFSKYYCIFDHFFFFLKHKIAKHWQIASIIQKFIMMLFKTKKVLNPIRFQLITQLLKNVVSKMFACMVHILLEHFIEQELFLQWFFANELNHTNILSVNEVWMNNQPGIQTLLVLVYYFLVRFPNRKDQVVSFLRMSNFLEEAKMYVVQENVKIYLRALYTQMGEEESEQIENYITSIDTQLPIFE